jgi:hypothetical protein
MGGVGFGREAQALIETAAVAMSASRRACLVLKLILGFS